MRRGHAAKHCVAYAPVSRSWRHLSPSKIWSCVFQLCATATVVDDNSRRWRVAKMASKRETGYRSLGYRAVSSEELHLKPSAGDLR